VLYRHLLSFPTRRSSDLEPISALDIYYQLHILNLLKTLCENERKTMIVVLHDLNLAARFCHRLLLLQKGRIVKHGTPEEVLTNPDRKSTRLNSSHVSISY